jgi:hypothetical protein
MRLLIVTMLFVTGCAGQALSENECRGTNWYERGEQDALMGNRPKIDLYNEQCSRFSAAPAEQEYMNGWAAGYGEWNRRVSGRRG